MTRNQLIAKIDACHPYSCQHADDVDAMIKARRAEAFQASMAYLDAIPQDRIRQVRTHTQCQSKPRQWSWSAILHSLSLGRLGR